MSTEQPARRRGRERSRADRTAVKHEKFPYIRRAIPNVNLFDEETLVTIEANADRILEEIGIEFRRDPESLELWRKAGADIKGERVHIPRGLARALLATAPRQFTHHARNPARSVVIGGNNTVFAPVGGAPFVTDLDRGRRYGSIEDFTMLTKIAYMCPAIHHAGFLLCEPTDVPVNKRHLDMVYSLIRHTDQPFLGASNHGARAADSIHMARLLFGKEFVEHNTVIMCVINSNSPLVFDSTMINVLKEYARANQGVIVTPAVLAGAMGPVTTAGCIAQILAESMAGMALCQLVRPGAPVVFGSFVGGVSMQTGAPTFGTPNASHMLFAVAELGRRLGVPVRSGGSLCASKTPDAQAAYESAQTLLATVLAGVNFVMHGAGWLEGGLAASPEKMVLDADQLAMMQKMAEGLDMSEKAQAMEAFREVGPGGHFLGCAHTQETYQTAIYNSTVADYTSYEQWSQEGSLTAAERANKIWKRLLDAYEAPPLDLAIDDALQAFVLEKKASMPDGLE